MKKLIILLIVFCSQPGVSQKYLNNLAFLGYNYGGNDSNFVLIDYKNGTPINQYIDSSDLKMNSTLALIADSVGNLLFYTNGTRIGNKNFEVIPNGDTLDASPCGLNWGQQGLGLNMPNGAFFLPSLSNPNEVLLFHNDCDYIWLFNIPVGLSHYLWFTVLDTSMNNGLGGVVTRNNVLYNGELGWGGLQAVKHANGRDYWIVAQDLDTSYFITWLYTDAGFSGPYFQNMNIPLWRASPLNSNFNRQGSKYATTAWNYNLMLFDFDRCSGQFKFNNQEDTSWMYLGAQFCFSANGNKIYRTDGKNIFQYDTADVDFNISRDTVAVYDGFFDDDSTKFSTMYLAADNKIYINAINTKYQHVINKPDLTGLACNVVQHSIKHPLWVGHAFPNYINYDLGPLVGSPCDTLSVLTPALSKGEGVIHCYPNPATNEVNIKVNNVPLGNYALSIYSPLVTEVMHIAGNNSTKDFTKTLQVQGLASGVYFVKLQVDGMEWYGRFVRE